MSAIMWRKRRRRNLRTRISPTWPICWWQAGRYGQKTGAGWYRYADRLACAAAGSGGPGVHRALPSRAGITPREVTDAEIVQRCIYALVNEGARILEEGIAQRSSDIDIVYLNGYGFPAYRGGPMFYADQVRAQ